MRDGALEAIQTTYAGVKFRSRLEARWAAFFDLAGWPWEYEPFDLHQWIPDFRLTGAHRVLCEVKPIDFAPLTEAECGKAAMTGAANVQRVVDEWDGALEVDEENRLMRRRDFPYDHEILVLGLAPVMLSDKPHWYEPALGVFLREQWETGGPDIALFGSGYETVLDFRAQCGSFAYRIGGQHDGDHHLKGASDGVIDKLWKEAGNRVQWRK